MPCSMMSRTGYTQGSKVKYNFFANLMGRGGLGIIQLITIPILLKFFTAEEYGLIGLYLSFLPAFFAVSMGLNAAYNRVSTQWQAGAFRDQDYHDLTFSLEFACWCCGIMIFFVFMLLSKSISLFWLTSQNIPPSTIQYLVILMAGGIVCQVPMSLYLAGLNGLQIQVVPNILLFSSFFLQGFGGLILVNWISASLEVYFTWLLVVNVIVLLAAKVIFGRCVGNTGPRKFRVKLLLDIAKMGLGAGGGVLLGVCLVHVDKVILSGMLDLETYGIYTLAWFFASSIYLLANPMFTAVYPRMSEFLASGDVSHLIGLYHNAHKFISCLIFPFAFTLMIFAGEVLYCWTGRTDIAADGAFFLSVLTAGCLLNALGYAPYALQLAYGWSTLGFYLNAVSLPIYLPCVVIAAKFFGAAGAATSFAILFLFLYPIGLGITHNKILKKEFRKVMLNDVMPVAIIAAVIVILVKLIYPVNTGRVEMIFWIGASILLSATCSLFSISIVRQKCIAFLNSIL